MNAIINFALANILSDLIYLQEWGYFMSVVGGIQGGGSFIIIVKMGYNEFIGG